MGLTSWRGTKVRKQDVVVAKNYLDEEELRALNNLAEQYLIFAEGQAMRRIPMHMYDWVKKLDGFMTLNDRDILDHAGKVSHQVAKELAESEYGKFHQQCLKNEALRTELEDIAALEKLESQLASRSGKPSRKRRE